jgi:processive 1,2-diacylglycerol beta-glucosyltransferase
VRVDIFRRIFSPEHANFFTKKFSSVLRQPRKTMLWREYSPQSILFFMAKKILVISMKAGWGHIKAAEALEEYAANNLPDFKINHVDLCEIEPLLGKFFEIFYDISNDRLPMVWGAVYDTFDKEPVSLAFRKINGFQRLFKRRIGRYLKRQAPDGVIFTNVCPAPMIAPSCRQLFPDMPLAVVVTDYHGHSYYNVPLIDKYFVAIPEVKNDLARVGVDSGKIDVTGIPVSQKFYGRYDRERLKRKLGLNNGLKTILFVSRLSKDFVVPAAQGILEMDEKVNLVMVCAGNNDLYRKVRENVPAQENFKLVNWTNRLDEYMKVSDAVISKPGGLIISECLALGKRIIMTDPIPGQEERNAEFMAKCGYGELALGADDIVEAVGQALVMPKVESAADRPNACAKILEFFK